MMKKARNLEKELQVIEIDVESERTNRIIPFEIDDKFSNVYYSDMLWDIISQ